MRILLLGMVLLASAATGLCPAIAGEGKLTPITGTTGPLKTGGGEGLATMDVKVDGDVWTLVFDLRAKYEFHVFGGEPSRKFITKFELVSIRTSSPISYKDPKSGTTYSAADFFSRDNGAVEKHDAGRAFDSVKLIDYRASVTFDPGGPNSATTVFKLPGAAGEQGKWGWDTAALPSWDKFLDGMSAERAKGVYETLLRHVYPYDVEVKIEDCDFAGLSDFKRAVEKSLRDQAQGDRDAVEARASSRSSAKNGGYAASGGGTSGGTASRRPAGRGSASSTAKSGAGVNREQLRRNMDMIKDAIDKKAELERGAGQSRPSGESRGRSRPGTAFNVGASSGAAKQTAGNAQRKAPPAPVSQNYRGNVNDTKTVRRTPPPVAPPRAIKPVQPGGGRYVDGDWEAVRRDSDAAASALDRTAGITTSDGKFGGIDMEAIRRNPDAVADAIAEAMNRSTTTAPGFEGVDRDAIRKVLTDAVKIQDDMQKTGVPGTAGAADKKSPRAKDPRLDYARKAMADMAAKGAVEARKSSEARKLAEAKKANEARIMEEAAAKVAAMTAAKTKAQAAAGNPVIAAPPARRAPQPQRQAAPPRQTPKPPQKLYCPLCGQSVTSLDPGLWHYHKGGQERKVPDPVFRKLYITEYLHCNGKKTWWSE